MTTTRLVTIEEIASRSGNDTRYEIVEGILREMPPAGGEHGGIAYELVARVDRYEPSRRLVKGFIAETGFVLARDPDTLVAPDAAFVLRDRLPPRDRWRGPLEMAPDMVLEVVSPSDRPAEIAMKVAAYLAAGTRIVWLADPASRRVTVLQPGQAPRSLSENDELDGGDVLPGFRLKVGEIFL